MDVEPGDLAVRRIVDECRAAIHLGVGHQVIICIIPGMRRPMLRIGGVAISPLRWVCFSHWERDLECTAGEKSGVEEGVP